MFFGPKIFSIYITKEIFKYFFAIFFGLLLLFFAVDFFETTKDSKNIENAIKISTQIVLFRIPSLLETILHFILLLSGLFAFYKLSNNSEIIIIRSSGRSIFQIIRFPTLIAFLFGAFVVTVYNPIASSLNVKSERLRNIHFRHEKGDLFESKTGIWFRQKDFESEGNNIVIRASRVYKDLLVFNDVILMYIDENNDFIKRVNVNILKLYKDHWVATNNYIIEENKRMKFVDQIIIPTNLTKTFVSKTIKNDYESLYNIPFWDLRNSIKELKASGFDTLKFQVRYYYLLTVPFLFAIMVLISAYFGIVHNRETKKYVSLIQGIAVGFLIFISHNIIVELTNAETLTVFDGSTLIIFIYILLAFILLIKKDNLSNVNAKIF